MSLTLFACGDYLNARSTSDFLSDDLRNIVCDSDIAICNLEAPILCEFMSPIAKAGPNIYQSRESILFLKNAGFNILSLANNHIYDYGDVALRASIEEIEAQGLEFVGAGRSFSEAYQAKYIFKNDIKIGFIAACENEFGCLYEEEERGGYPWLLHHKIEDNIREVRNKVDFLIMIAHAGVEDIEIPIKEWRDRYRRFCDLGVDIVIGHHPHVPQGYEKYGQSYIFYSLGNFYFDSQEFVNSPDDSFSVLLHFEKGKSIRFTEIYHRKINFQVQRISKAEASFSLDYLNALLCDGYITRNDKICLELYSRYYLGYYESALNALPSRPFFFSGIFYFFKFIIKRWLKIILMNTEWLRRRRLLLLHNIRIDSHRFVVQRALHLLSERDPK